jgi:ubiquinone/menaquinone biosynthesis C-methylase UbiE
LLTAHVQDVESANSLAALNVLFFDAAADAYDDWLHGVHRKLAARLIEMGAPAAGESVLDVGCGTGLFAAMAAEEVGPAGEVVGIDLSSGMLARARGREAPNLSYFRASADEALWFKDDVFDLVLFSDSLTYLESPPTALQDAFRMLRPGGRLALAVPRRSLITHAQELSRQAVERALQTQPLTVPRARPQISLLGEPDLLLRLLEDIGFIVLDLTTFVTGVRTASSAEWLEVERWSNPRTHLLLSALGPAMRQRLAEHLDWPMRRMGDDAFRHHQAFTLVTATR